MLIALYYPTTRCLHAIELQAGFVPQHKRQTKKMCICRWLSLYHNLASDFSDLCPLSKEGPVGKEILCNKSYVYENDWFLLKLKSKQ